MEGASCVRAAKEGPRTHTKIAETRKSWYRRRAESGTSPASGLASLDHDASLIRLRNYSGTKQKKNQSLSGI